MPNSPELLNLALAVLEKSAPKNGTATGTVVGHPLKTSVPPSNSLGTSVREVIQGDNPTVPLSQPLGNGTMGHPQKEGCFLGQRLGQSWDTPYKGTLHKLQGRCPDLVEPERWLQAIGDAETFLTTWGETALRLGWTARDLFGLLPVPANPGPQFRRLARYDATGLVWLLQGQAVIALTADQAAIQSRSSVLVYRRYNKPAIKPVGDCIDDLEGPL